MVVLTRDSLAGDPATIAQIQVLETIKDSRSVYRRN